MKRLTFFLCLLCSASYAAPKQQTINFTPGLGGPITTSTAETSEKGTWGFSQRMEYYPSKLFTDQQLLENLLLENQNSYFINYLALSYGLTNNITIGVNVPYIHSSNLRAAIFDDETEIATVTRLGNSYGIGDTNFFALWNLYDDEKYPIAIAVLTGIDVPTGRTRAKDFEGTVFAASDQPGSGAFSPLAGLIITQAWDTYLWSANVIYTQTTEGTQNTTLGSTFSYSIAGVYELYENNKLNFSLDAILELNGEYAFKDNIAGFKDPNSGGNSIFATAGLRGNMGLDVSAYVGITLPVSEDYNGTQLKTKYGVIAGIDFNLG